MHTIEVGCIASTAEAREALYGVAALGKSRQGKGKRSPKNEKPSPVAAAKKESAAPLPKHPAAPQGSRTMLSCKGRNSEKNKGILRHVA